LNTAIARTIADEIRLIKFILTPKGIIFGLKQAVLQRFNTKAETRSWNPLSIYGSVVPTVHVNRHLTDEGAFELQFLATNPVAWATDRMGNLASNFKSAHANDGSSLANHIAKEQDIIGGSARTGLLARLDDIFGDSTEKSRTIDKISNSNNNLFRAVEDVGDQGSTGHIVEAPEGTKLGFFYSDDSTNTNFKTSKLDRVNAIPYGSVAGNTRGLPQENVRDFIPFRFYDVPNKKWIIFRASLSGISDSVTPE
jgi:hypothetical protein